MYVIDELGGFPECAYSLLLSYQSSHPSRGGDQRVAGHRLASFCAPFIGEVYIPYIHVLLTLPL